MPDETELRVPISGREAHLDLLLAEELSVNAQFRRRFIQPIWEPLTRASPVGEDLSAVVRLNVWDDGGSGCAASDGGENDIDVLFSSQGHTLRVLIEDKVWAVFQPDQAGRYERRARSRGDGLILVAPRSRLVNTGHTRCFHVVYGIEDLADWLIDEADAAEGKWMKRLRWRAEMLRQLCVPTAYVPKPDHPPTVAFTTFCVDWLATREPRAVPNAKSLRTQNSGWLYFTNPSGLVYKASHGRVDLYVAEHGFKGTAADLAAAVSAGWSPQDFVAAVDSSGNAVLRFERPEARVSPQDGVPPDVTGVVTALKAAVTAVRWIAANGSAVSLPSS